MGSLGFIRPHGQLDPRMPRLRRLEREVYMALDRIPVLRR
jgi:hypothetical protein